MLKHAVEWVQMAATGVEAVLLIRVFTLKLHRVYAFITLYCALNVLFDAASWYFGWEAPETGRISTYSLFLFAALYPIVAWDVFEESKAQVAKLRRLQAIRLVSGLFITGICAILLGLNIDATDANGNSALPAFLGVFLLTGSASACAAFLWFLQRFIRAQKIVIAHNTMIWIVFFILALSLEIVDCMAEIIRPFLPAPIPDITALVLLACEMALLTWCILRLRAIASDVPSARENASL
jgi:hypothetical protein